MEEMNFKNFEFSTPDFGGIQYINFWTNGYGVSVVQHPYSYGGTEGLWELAILEGNSENWNLCYETDITSDVLGYLTDFQVNQYCIQVSNLKSNNN